MAIQPGDACFIDTNLLVYAAIAESPLHGPARRILANLEENEVILWISRQVLREYLAILTRPQTFVPPVSIKTLELHVRNFQQRYRVADENSDVTQQLLYLLNTVQVGGKQIHDANIVATMLVYNIPNITANAAISCFSMCQTYPLE
jgi:predicted nucleic acid-binding protein